jgi:hypothetical protein
VVMGILAMCTLLEDGQCSGGGQWWWRVDSYG